MKHNPTTAIKCHFSNEVHKLLEPNINVKKRQRWQHKKITELTDAQKLEIFEKILILHQETSNELTSYQYNRRQKKRIEKARVERGYVPKKKTSKEEFSKTAK